MTRGIETWLSDSRASSNSVVDHRSRRYSDTVIETDNSSGK